MKTTLYLLAILLLIVPDANAQKSAASDRTAVSITVYNQNLSLIREERTINFNQGIGSIIVPDIPSTIDGTSLHFQSITNPAGVRVLEQNYAYDLVNQGKLLDRYIGKEVEFIRTDPESKKEYTVKGRLLASGLASAGGGFPGFEAASQGVVAEINGKIELNPVGRLVLPSLPDGLILKPQLEWLVSATNGGKHNAEISYLAGGLSWTSDYVALMDKNGSTIDLTGWVTLTNNSGTSFRDAALKLVAGDVNVVRQQFNEGMMGKAMRMDMAAAEPQFKQTDLFEYKLYSLQRKTNLDNNQTKQIELITGTDVPSKKLLVYDGLDNQWRYWLNNYDYRGQGTFGQQSNPKVGVYIVFRNDEKSHLGMPLPKGRIRLYQRDDDGKEQFIGEDQIDHTPKDEELRLYVGNAFDVIGERAQADFKTIASGKVVEETIRIKLRNHKKEAVDVVVYEHPWRWNQWEIIHKTDDYEKVDQATIKFPVRVGKDEEKTITYTIRYSW